MLSRAKPAAHPDEASRATTKKKRDMPSLDTFLDRRDYVGALTLLEFMKSTGSPLGDTDEWMAYASFHLGDYRRAYDVSAFAFPCCRRVFPELRCGSWCWHP